MKEASYYKKLDNDKVECNLCPHNCKIHIDEKGSCGVRKNLSGFLFSENYKMLSAFSFDPIEKKPLYHFYPGQEILSIGTYGCNMKCNFCQNCEISQEPLNSYNRFNLEINDIIDAVSKNKNNIGVAFTYNEPVVWIEYLIDIAKEIDSKYKKVMITNGFINKEPLKDLLPYIDAFNVDLKAFNDDFYKNETKSFIEPVKEALKTIVKAGKHLEITNLIIPEKNDKPEEFVEMVKWIKNELGENIPLHISRYFPRHKSLVKATSIKTLESLFEIAEKELNYVYLGNVEIAKGQNTYCPNCNSELILRSGYYTVITEYENGKCRVCGADISVVS